LSLIFKSLFYIEDKHPSKSHHIFTTPVCLASARPVSSSSVLDNQS